MRPLLVFLATLVACAPPEIDLNDDTGGGGGGPALPSMRIVQPLDSSTVDLQPDCSLRMNIAIDVDNFEILEGAEVVEGEGHWHVAMLPDDDPYGSPVFNQFLELEREGPFEPGLKTIDVRLVDHQHFDILVANEPVADRVEFALADPTGACTP